MSKVDDDSKLPTLLRKGFLVPPKGLTAQEKEKIANSKAIDFICNFISDRIPKAKNGTPKIKAKSVGDKVIVLKSETGSGKSTAYPYALYEQFQEITRKNIAITQPRILNALDIPRSMTEYTKDLELGKNIGYLTGEFKLPPSEKGLIYMTIGTLTAQLINDTSEDFMERYSFIIIDEVHTRSIDTDTCLFLIKKFLEENYDNPKCPIITLASATFDEKIFMDYFKVPKQNYFQVIGSTFPIEEKFAEYDIQDYLEYALLKAQQIHIDNFDDIDSGAYARDILLFVQFESIGEKLVERLNEFNSNILSQSLENVKKYGATLEKNIQSLYIKGGDEVDEIKEEPPTHENYYVLPVVLSKKSFERGGMEYKNLFGDINTLTVPVALPPAKGQRKGNAGGKENGNGGKMKLLNPVRRIILATNIAETGVTIPTLKYCIDTGLMLNVEFNPDVGCMFMTTKNLTRGMAIQRKGRVGRKAPGFWYPCYTKETFEALSEDQFSEIIISDTTENILSIIVKENDYELIEETNAKKLKAAEDFNLFQTNYMSDTTWYKLFSSKNTNISTLEFLEFPSASSMSYSMEKLHVLGFIDDEYNLTPTGFYANKIRFISLECRKMILSGFCYGSYVLDLITIAAFIYITPRNVFEKGFKLPNFLKRKDSEFEFYNNILIADELINCLFVWNMFNSFVSDNLNKLYKSPDVIQQVSKRETLKLNTGEYKKILYTKQIVKWCEDIGIKYSGLLDVIAIRDVIIENIITVGINPYYNSLELKKHEYNLNEILDMNLQDGLEEIKKIKQSIYEGFKLNVLKSNKFGYSTIHRNIPVKIKSPMVKELNSKAAEQTKPKYILTSSYMISQKFGSAQFEFTSNGYISVLDNFVSVDEKLFLN